MQRLAPLGDGRVVIATGAYGEVSLFDPKTGAYERLGSPAQKNVYDLLVVNGQIYFCGYPNSAFGMFEADGGKLLGTWHDVVGSKHALYMVVGADGHLYSGNHAEREFVAGARGWYDPATGDSGGIRFPNDDCEWLTTALEGKLIVYASDVVKDPMHPEIEVTDGSLIVYDTTTRQIVRRFSQVRNGSAGRVVEIAPGVVLGLSLHEGRPVMYKADVTARTVLSRVDLPGEPKADIKRGPDGMIYTFLGDMLARIEPATGAVTPICNLEPTRMVFVGNDLYLAGEAELRRIRGLAQ